MAKRSCGAVAAACWSGLLVAGVLAWAPAHAEILLPAGFTREVYVTGEGFHRDGTPAARGIPSSSTLAFDDDGHLYVARSGRRYVGGDVEDIWPVYRIPRGGGKLSPGNESRYFHGPPVPNPQIAMIRGGRELFVTTFDRDRRIGVLYRIVDGRPELFAGGTPPRGTPPLLRQPEGAAADAAGNVYVADRDQNVIVKLDASGRVLDARWLRVQRPRTLAMDGAGRLWVGSDGAAESPWQRGPGAILTVTPDGAASVVVEGPVAAGIAIGPAGRVFLADRGAAKVSFIARDGRLAEFAAFTDGDAPRGLAFAPATAATRRAGIAGDLFVIAISRSAWAVNEVVRISGPFDQLVGAAAP